MPWLRINPAFRKRMPTKIWQNGTEPKPVPFLRRQSEIQYHSVYRNNNISPLKRFNLSEEFLTINGIVLENGVKIDERKEKEPRTAF